MVTIKETKQAANYWHIGESEHFTFQAVVFDEGSSYGINEGRVSKLYAKCKKTGVEPFCYDRGWCKKPKTAQEKREYAEILKFLEALPASEAE